MKIENLGDEETNWWVISDESGKVLAQGRDKSKVIREATNKGEEQIKHLPRIVRG